LGVQLGDLGLHLLEQVPDVLGPAELLAYGLQGDRLGQLPSDEHPVLAGALRSKPAGSATSPPCRSLTSKRISSRSRSAGAAS
jgi:hypothetical protein